MFKGATGMSSLWNTHPSFNNGSPSVTFFSDPIDITTTTIYDAVDLWLINKNIAQSAYGYISSWNTSNVTDMSGLFKTGRASTVSLSLIDSSSFNEDISIWETGKVSDMSEMFKYAYSFNNGSASNDKLKPLNWNTSEVKNMEYMFYSARAFNQNLPTTTTGTTWWNVSNVTNMKNMFNDATVFDGDMGTGWNVDDVQNMQGMFTLATAFNQNITQWQVQKVTNMKNMFYGGAAFNQDIAAKWNPKGSVFTNNAISNMFLNAPMMALNFGLYTGWGTSPLVSFFKTFTYDSINATNIYTAVNAWTIDNSSSLWGPIHLWDTSAVTDMSGLFADASGFNDDISNWNTSM